MMKVVEKPILNVFEDYDNLPELIIPVDSLPPLQEIRYYEEDFLYWGEKHGYVSFFADSDDNRGFGGRRFDITLVDETPKSLKGPWSGNPRLMNENGFPHCMDVTWVDTSWSRITGISGAALVDWVDENVDEVFVTGKWRGLDRTQPVSIEKYEFISPVSPLCLMFREYLYTPGVICSDGKTPWFKPSRLFSVQKQHFKRSRLSGTQDHILHG